MRFPAVSPRLLAATLLACAAHAVPAAAQTPAPTPVAPVDSTKVQAGAPVTFTARGQGALVVRVSASPATVDACGAIGEDGGRFDGSPSPADPTLVQFTAVAGLAAGEWFWQVGDPADCAAGPVRRIVADGSTATPAPPAQPKAPATTRTPRLAHAAIPKRIGTSNHALFVLALGKGSPAVPRSRFITLVHNSAKRWRLDARGPVDRVPRLGDGHSDVGFAGALVSPGALATTTLLRRNYVRVRRICQAGGCTTVRTPAGSRVVERDLALRPDLPWAPGPAYPTDEQVDLETVLLHELGHYAGNLRHAAVGCNNTPMVEALGAGEWWRSPTDWHYDACDGGQARALGAPSLSTPFGITERVIEQTVYVR
jgi:hypothetical protein